jgi:transposase
VEVVHGFINRSIHINLRMMTPLEARLTEEVAALRVENKLLKEKIDLLVRRIFGRSSEQLNEQQLMLLLQGGEKTEEPKKPEASWDAASVLEAELKSNEGNETSVRREKKTRELRVPGHLPVSERLVIEPEEVQANPAAYRHVRDEVTEQLDYAPGRFTRRLIVRPKYVKREEPLSAPIIAKLAVLQDRSKAAPGLLAQIIVNKYCDHLPLYRQEQIYRLRHGIDIPRQSMARWLVWAADWLRPVYEGLRTGVLAGGYVQVDETMIEYLKPGHGRTKQGYFWTLKRPGGDSVFMWNPSRSGESLNNIIPVDFKGTLGVDGYAAYQSYAASSDGRIRLAACWAHARRKFDEARESAPQRALIILRQIQQLYRIEKRLRRNKSGPRLRAAVRQAESRPIIERIGKLLRMWKQHGRHLPQSLMGKAIEYTLNLWDMLAEYWKDGRVEIDNNEVERAIRPTAVGKKNWLFIGDEDAGATSATLFTIIEACRRRNIDPWSYLRDVLTRLPTMTNQQTQDVMPDVWAKAQRAS